MSSVAAPPRLSVPLSEGGRQPRTCRRRQDAAAAALLSVPFRCPAGPGPRGLGCPGLTRSPGALLEPTVVFCSCPEETYVPPSRACFPDPRTLIQSPSGPSLVLTPRPGGLSGPGRCPPPPRQHLLHDELLVPVAPAGPAVPAGAGPEPLLGAGSGRSRGACDFLYGQ